MRSERITAKVRVIKQELRALYLAYKDPRVPWYARVMIAIVVGYAFSPVDLIPDPIPVLGYLDDLVLIPFGIYLVIKLVPSDVLAECREKAALSRREHKTRNWVAACVIIAIWISLFAVTVYYCSRLWKN